MPRSLPNPTTASRGDSADPVADQPAEVRAFTGLLAPVARRVLFREADRRRFALSQTQYAESGVRDFEFCTAVEDADPDRVFARLRWGGQFIFVSARPREIEQRLADFRAKPEWQIDQPPESVTCPRFEHLNVLKRLPLPAGLRRLLLEQRAAYFVARKILIDPTSNLTAKYSYDVSLTRASGKVDQKYATDGFVVLKRVPTLEQTMQRLQQTASGVPADRLEAIAEKLVRKVFPIFLTREAAFLKLLQRDLPPRFKVKTPRVLSMEADDAGLVRAMSMRWMRQGGPTISQTAFAQQSAELLRALHDQVGIMHLDLRLDNMLVTDRGVCIIDFGSSVRVGEDFSSTPMIDTMIREMLQSSQITRDLQRQRRKNLIRADLFADLPHPPTPAFDLFALATQMTRPHDNADFKGLVHHDRDSDEGLRFSRLRKRILQPTPDDPPIRSVHDLCVELNVAGEGGPAATAPPTMTLGIPNASPPEPLPESSPRPADADQDVA